MKKLILLGIVFLLTLLALPFTFADNLILQDANSENLQDTYSQPSISQRGDLDWMQIQGFTSRRIYITFNISALPSGATINTAELYLYQYSGESGSINVDIHQVYAKWDELVLTHENQPCGTAFNNATNCNLTIANTTTVDNIVRWNLWNVTGMVKKAYSDEDDNVSMVLRESTESIDKTYHFKPKEASETTLRPNLNITYTPAAPDTTPPELSLYNMTSEGGEGCTNWRTDKTNPCSTGDTTPTVSLTTNENAFCAIGVSNLNYTNMGSSRNCTGGEGTMDHTCTLTPQDELTFEDSTIYISCKDSSGNENLTSSSGALSLTITGLEAVSEATIGVGVQNALLSGYTNYTNQQIYARKLDGTQDFGTFDWVAKKGNKVWAFNHITKGEEHVGMFNLTPVLYVLEMANITNSTIINTVELMINATK